MAANKGRSTLTILGIVIGIMAIIIVMAIGQSAQDLIVGQIQGLGSKTIAVVPGREPQGPADVASVFLDSLKERDLESLRSRSNVPYGEQVLPVVFGTARMAYENETYQATVLGSGDKENDNIFSEVFDIYPDQGVMYTAADVRAQASVAVIGSKVAEELFPNNGSPVGEKIKINGRNFRVVGVLPDKGQVSLFNFDDMVLVPYTTAQQYVLGRKYFDRFIVLAESDETVEQTVKDVEITLRNNHNIDDPEKDDFFVETQAGILERISSITTILTILLTAIAAISLVVGGVGIMNIMLVSVTERTREVGLRKALGATNRDILWQFLLDAVFLTCIGGVVGIALGSLITFLSITAINQLYQIGFTFSFPVGAAVIGIIVSALVGLVFGIYPAWKASLKSPIEALRYE